jgi:hypothetical protein
MQTIDARMRKTEAEQRKKFLTMNLRRHGVTATDDGRDLDTLRIAELEWMYVKVLNDAERRRVADLD